MSDANRVGLAYVVESTYGTTPSGPPTLKNLRYVSESLKQRTTTIKSQEVRSDRQTSDIPRVGLDVGGTIEGEFSYDAYPDFYEWGFQADATWSSALDITINSATINITIAASGSNFTLTRASGSYITDGFSATLDVGKWVKLGSTANPFTLAANNGYAKIVSVSALVLTVSSLAMSAATQSSGTVAIRRCSQIVNGTTFKSFSLEKSFPDLSSEFVVEKGCAIDGMSWDISIGAVAKTSFDIVGKSETGTSATAGTGTNTAVTTAAVMNTVDHISGVLEGGTVLGITKFTMKYANNLRARQQVATLGTISVGSGSIDITGTLEAYFTSKTQMDKYRNFTADTLAVKFVDSAGNAHILDLMQLKFTDGEQTGAGLNQDVFMKVQFTAYLNATELLTARMVRSVAN